MNQPIAITEQRLQLLEAHLRSESPFLVDVVASFRRLDWIARGLGLLAPDESFATQVSWWPLVSLLGTFSAGKSSFINTYLDVKLQRTGNQAVDDRFTVICYGSEPRTLPGVALDSDLRFPFYRISDEIERVAAGEGNRIDSYLQLKTLPSDKLRGRILIDSPGFDADAQRTSTLRITDQIIDLSDLVLVFFDARHPEPGAMRDTLEHLVSKTIQRSDAAKFLYVLNQIDTSAAEDNSEEVVAAWQRALAESGLTAGRFHVIYNPAVAAGKLSEAQQQRLEKRLSSDLADVLQRIENVSVSRAYRIVGTLEQIADSIAQDAVPQLQAARTRWRRHVLIADLVLLPLALFLTWLAAIRIEPQEQLLDRLRHDQLWLGVAIAAVVLVAAAVHYAVRWIAARAVAVSLRRRFAARADFRWRDELAPAFLLGTAWWRSLLLGPRGGGAGRMRQLREIQAGAHRHVQKLNESFTDPSGAQTTPAANPAT